jgi:hypothetical protein
VFKLFTGPSNARLLGPLPLEKIRFFAGVGLAWAAGKGKSKMGVGDSLYYPCEYCLSTLAVRRPNSAFPLLSVALQQDSHAFKCSR